MGDGLDLNPGPTQPTNRRINATPAAIPARERRPSTSARLVRRTRERIVWLVHPISVHVSAHDLNRTKNHRCEARDDEHEPVVARVDETETGEEQANAETGSRSRREDQDLGPSVASLAASSLGDLGRCRLPFNPRTRPTPIRMSPKGHAKPAVHQRTAPSAIRTRPPTIHGRVLDDPFAKPIISAVTPSPQNE